MQAEHLPTYELNVLSTPARSVTSRGAAAGRLGASLSLSTANKLLKLVHCRRCCKVAAAHLLSVKGMGDELQDLKGPASALAKFFFFSVALVAIPLGAVQLTLAGFLDGLVKAVFGANLYHSRPAAAGVFGTAGVLLVVAAYVTMAMLEPPPPKPPTKQD